MASRKRGETPESVDYTIVNPRHLDAALRDSVCEQCHLQGEGRALRRGKSLFDFRPGLPLADFVTIFVRPPELTQGRRAINHVEQIQVSRCNQASNGELGCISCHDPHVLPVREKRVSFYRDRCLSCHKEIACHLALEMRRTQNGDSCFECHMPRSESANIAHMAVTDHRIIRKPSHSPEIPDWLKPAGLPLLDYYQRQRPRDDSGYPRDLGVVMVDIARRPGPDQVRRQICRQAEPALQAAVKDHPDDVEALESLGFALWNLNQPRLALEKYEAALIIAPQREVALEEAARVAAQLGQIGTAIQFWERYVKASPYRPLGHVQLAQLWSVRGDWMEVRRNCQQAVKCDASHVGARALLARAYLELRDQAKAERELAVLRVLDAAAAAELERRIKNESKPR